MEYNFNKEVKLFMVFDILGDTERTGPLLWKIERKRLEDVKNHIMDLLFITRILKKHFPSGLDYNKITDYIIGHDLPEAITGDITKFEGVSGDEIKRVTNIAIDYLSNTFGHIMDFSTILNGYENKVDIESKIVHMIDKVHSSTTFIKYQSEQNVDMNKEGIISDLRNHPFVVQKIEEGKDLADIFFEFHLKTVSITDEECERYRIDRDSANKIVTVIRTFANEMYSQKQSGTLLDIKNDFPPAAMQYNRNGGNIMKTIEFDGDPMLQFESFDDISDKIFLLNQESLDEILSYCTTDIKEVPSYLKENVPSLNGIDKIVALAEGGIDEEGKTFPDTYIALEMYKHPDISGQILSIYASDMQYAKPATGEKILLKKNKVLKK